MATVKAKTKSRAPKEALLQPFERTAVKAISKVKNLNLTAQLQDYFGFDGFKEPQETIIKNLLAGNDALVIMPTGGGKSLCYQLPAIISEGCAIIVSPLIALMKNQVDLVRSYSSKDDVAHFLNSTLNKGQQKIVKDDLTTVKQKCYMWRRKPLLK